LQDIFSANYVHLGGDEYIPACWDFNTEIQQWMNSSGISNYSALFDYYFAQVNQFVEPGKTRIYWAAADLYNYTYLEGAIVQYWLDSDSGYDALQYIDNEIILSPYDSLYFDCGTGNLLGNEAWCDPWKPWW
jgi:hexosaminidase